MENAIAEQLNVTVIGAIGSGGFGHVFKGQRKSKDETLEEIRAFKIIIPQDDKSEIYNLNYALKEAFSICSNPHPHISKVYRAQIFEFESVKYVCLEMEYLPEGSLDKYLPLNEEMTKKALHQICCALEFMYSKNNMIHRDIKPSNILVRSINKTLGELDVVLTDFGFAKKLDSSTKTNVKAVGSNDYRAPELLLHTDHTTDIPYSVNCDIFSLGISAFKMLCNTKFIAINVRLTKKKPDVRGLLEEEFEDAEIDVSDEMKDIIVGMIQKDPVERTTYQGLLKKLTN